MPPNEPTVDAIHISQHTNILC